MIPGRDGDCGCGCCEGVSASTPVGVYNRAGLPTVRYRVGGYAQFRASLQAALTRATPPAPASAKRPALAALTTRDPDDFTIALLDGAACVADIVAFYSERLVNESYLRTARGRTSLAELGKLVGYRLRPGVAASTLLAFHVEPPPQARVTAATSPFHRVRMPESVVLAAGLPVRSVPGPGEQPQTFETGERIEARPQWNLLRPVTTRLAPVGAGQRDAYVAGSTHNLRAGDAMLFVGPGGWEMRPIATVDVQGELNRTHLTWRDPLTAGAPLTPYALRQRLDVFGHNAPMWKSMSADFRKAYAGDAHKDDPEWPTYLISGDCPAVDVTGSHPDIAVGGHVVLVAGDAKSRFGVAKVTELSRAQFGVSGTVTRIFLSGAIEDYFQFLGKVRETTVYAVSEELALAESPDGSPVAAGAFTVEADVADLPAGRTLLVAGTTVAGGEHLEAATLSSAVSVGPGRTRLVLTGDLAERYRRETVMVFGNVAAATHGETVHQILGNGDAARAFQRFPLRHAPLTFVPSGEPGGATSTLEVRVNDIAWHEVPTLYPARPDDHVFVTRVSETGDVVASTGDGSRGARLPTGQNNVRARYRKGIGAAGNLPAGALSQLAAPPLGVTGVTNPVPAVGGADPDSASHARAGIPLSTRTLGRAVSLTDYADYARTFAGIARAHAVVLPVVNGRTIVVTVAGEDGAPVPEVVRARLVASLRGHGDPLAPVVVVPHRPVDFQVSLRVRRDPDHELDTVLAAVAARLRAEFGFAARDFGQPVGRSAVAAAAHRAPGVVAVDVDMPPRLVPAGPEVVGGAPVGAQLLVLAGQQAPDWLRELS